MSLATARCTHTVRRGVTHTPAPAAAELRPSAKSALAYITPGLPQRIRTQAALTIHARIHSHHPQPGEVPHVGTCSGQHSHRAVHLMSLATARRTHTVHGGVAHAPAPAVARLRPLAKSALAYIAPGLLRRIRTQPALTIRARIHSHHPQPGEAPHVGTCSCRRSHRQTSLQACQTYMAARCTLRLRPAARLMPLAKSRLFSALSHVDAA